MTRRFIIMLAAVQAVFLIAILVIFTRHAKYFDFVCDDAFISFRYAENLVRHGQLAFNLGQRVEGYSNFLWTMLMAAGIWLGHDPVVLSRNLGWFFGAMAIFLTWRVGASWVERARFDIPLPSPAPVLAQGDGGPGRLPGRDDRIITIADNFRPSIGPGHLYNLEKQTAMMLTVGLTMLAPLILALSSSYACWASGGLETQMFTMLLAAAVFRFLMEERHEENVLGMEGAEGRLAVSGASALPRRWSGLLFALAAMTRPEAAAYFLLAAAWRAGKLLTRWRRARRAANAGESGAATPPAASLRRDIDGILYFLIPLVPWLIWKTYYYGDILPNTFHVKGGGGLKMLLRGGADLQNYLAATRIYILVPLILLGWLAGLGVFRRRFGGPASGLSMNFLLVASAAGVLYFVWIGGDFMELARFLVPILPFAALLSQEGILLLFGIAGAGRGRAGAHSMVLKWVFFLIVMFFFAFYGQFQLAASAYAMTDHSKGGTDSIGYLKKATRQWELVGKWIRQDAARSGLAGTATIATSASGAIPYYSGMPTLDLLGLNDPFIPKQGMKLGERPGHVMAADWSYMLLWHADYFVGHPEIDPQPKTLGPFDIAYMTAMGYERRAVQIPGLDPPWFQFWYRTGTIGGP